jgi:alpha-beta hydrolase superfamily lysophospholipase
VTRPTAEQLDALRQSLPPFTAAQPLSAEQDAFCAFYGIDFEQHLSGVRHEFGQLRSGQFKLAVHCWQQAGARRNLVLMHGYYDHVGLYGKLIRWALDSGYNVLAFDLPGHGLSTGEPASIDDFSQYSQALQDVLAGVTLPELPLWAMGQSTGCAVLMDYARRFDWPFEHLVLLAPLIWPAQWWALRLVHKLTHRLLDTVPRTFARNSSDADFLQFIQADPLQSRVTPSRWVTALKQWLAGMTFENLGVGPALIVQGDKDGTVDWRHNMAQMPALFPGCSIEYVPGAGHQLANESECFRRQYLKRIQDWVEASPRKEPAI